MTAVMKTYGRLPIAFTHGKGAWLYDEDNNAYIDALGGIAVCGLGHCHPAVTDAIRRQSETLLHTSNLYTIPAQEQLASKLCQAAGMDNVFFSNSGAEANEAAIKVARKFGNNKGVELPTIVVCDNAFHGRTMATLTATGSRKVHQGFEPLVRGFARAPYNDVDAIKNIVENNANVVAIMVEPIQGEAGIIPANEGYLKALRDLCDEHDLLLMLDEIQTGVGRTGKFYAFQHEDIVPDVLTSAKALGNGVPIGACMTAGKARDILQPGNHGSTYGGNFLACAAALAVVDEVANETMLNQIASKGQQLLDGLKTRFAGNPNVGNFRGKGMMMAFDVNPDFGNLMQRGLDHKVVLNVTGNNSIRLLPPYILTDEEIDTVIDRVAQTVESAAPKEA